IIAASTSRVNAIGSLLFIIINQYSRSHCRRRRKETSNCRSGHSSFPSSSSFLSHFSRRRTRTTGPGPSHILRLGGDGSVLVAFQRRRQGVPGKNRAFHTRREFVPPREDGQFADISHNPPGGYHFMYLLEDFLNFVALLTFHRLSEQRGRGF